MDETTLKARARRAYELARLRRAMVGGVVAVPVMGIGALNASALGVGLGIALFLLCVGLLWWGRAAGRAVLPGVAMGTLGSGVLATGVCHTGLGAASCALMTGAVGLVAGGVVGWLASRQVGRARWTSLGAGLLVAAVAGSVGCMVVGVVGVVGLVAGLIAGGGVAALRPRAVPS